MRLSVVIPIFNEATVIANTLAAIQRYFADRPQWVTEILVVDDCSTDNSVSLVEQVALQNKVIRLLCNETNRGKGYSIKRGVEEARGDYILFMDADLSTPLDQFEVLWWAAREDDVVIASRGLADSRIIRHQSWFKERAANLGNSVIRLFLGLPYQDTQCGFKLFPARAKSVFEYQTIDRWGFDMEILYVAHKRGFHIVEVPVVWVNDPTTTVKKFDYVVVLLDIFRILYNDWRGVYNEKMW
ncbi:MAG: glycosyltransferase family 2 protein [Candidatus Magasanikbacteria bacterium]|nr:glycosyltransferase family 2 protein [Candidatus Magasanikbacteria bacterium]